MTEKTGYASVRPFLYFDLFTSTRLLRPFVKSGLLIDREAQVEVQFWSKESSGWSKLGGSKYIKGRTDAYPENKAKPKI